MRAPRAAGAGESAWGRFRRSGGVGGTLLALVLYLAVLAMDLSPVEPFGHRLGEYLPEDVHAQYRFRLLLPDLMEEARGRAQRSAPAVFQFDPGASEEIVRALRVLPRRLSPTSQPAAGDTAAPADPNVPSPWRALVEDPNALQAYTAQVDRLTEQLPRSYVIRRQDPDDHKPQWRWPDRALLLTPSGTVEKDIDELTDVGDAAALGLAAGRLITPFAPALRKDVAACLQKALLARPTYRYDRMATQDRIDRAVAAVEASPPPEAFKIYDVGERIAQRSRRKDAAGQTVLMGLDAKDLAVLRAEYDAARAQATRPPLRYWARVAGRAAMLALVVLLLALYVAKYQPALVRDPRRAFALLIVLLLMLGLNKVLVAVLRVNPCASVLPVLLAAAVLTIGSHQRFALAVGAAVTTLVVFQVRADMGLFLVLMVGVAAVIFQLDEIRTRTKLIRVAAIWAGVVFAAVWVVGLATAVPWPFALIDAAWAGGCAILVGLVVQGLLPLLERVLRVATSLTLLEWCDASRPLLRRLAMEAPGTYNHSLQLGAMCESAAEAVKAGGLLARVGAYYHDIGKINKPDYFVENHSGATSRHDRLSPAMSLLIIIGHVKDGIEMAREYALPEVLHEFIATHHGTTLVQYFYKAATEQRKSDTDRAPDEMEFRYPGPKPHSKEAAILMLADAAESSTRAMSEPTPGRIENQVHTMVTRRLMDGQLDECDLTLREVHEIETSLIKSLCGIYHSRIAYPTPPGEKPSAGELEAERKKAESGGKGLPEAPAREG
ncbi:MAG TPA: HDIG domain-containing protein [Phycisphaerae bacterium]|nr:HDIG domain-containing protein [Phycisphaerae bacterium]